MEEYEEQKINQDLNLNSLSTIQKVLFLQRLVKEMTAKKKIFLDSKEKLISKIDQNCYKYFEGRIKAKKSFNYINNKEEKNYKLIKNTEENLGNLYQIIYNFYFLLQNDNSLMIKLIESCDKIYFEELSDFFTHFLYVNIINFSFVESKLIKIIYLLLEKLIIETLPDKIENNKDIPINYLNNTFLSHVFKSLTRKMDIRNFLGNILNESILRIESIRMTLSVECKKVNPVLNLKNNFIYRSFFTSIGSLKEEEIHKKKRKFKGSEKRNQNINNYIKGNSSLRRTNKLNLGDSGIAPSENSEKDNEKEEKKESDSNPQILYEYEILDEKGKRIEPKKIEEKNSNLFKKRTTKGDNEEKKEKEKMEDKNQEENQQTDIEQLKIGARIPSNKNNSNLNKLGDKYFIPLDIFRGKSDKLTKTYVIPKNNEGKKVQIDILFLDNNVTREKIYEKLEEYMNDTENNINSAMKEYLNGLLKQLDNYKANVLKSNSQDLINENISSEDSLKEEFEEEEIFSLSIFTKELNSISLNKNEESFVQLIKKIRINHRVVCKIITNIIDEISKNLATLPYSLKYIFKIINDLLEKKYSNEKGNNLSPYQNYMFKINFFIGNIILPIIKNPYYNGIIYADLISEITKENMEIIYDIFDKMITGKLFNKKENPYMTLYNDFIIKTQYKIFELIDNLGKIFEIPSNVNILIKSINEEDKSQRNINYDYFQENPEENIEFQCICTSLDHLHTFYCILEKNSKILIENNNNIEQKKILKDLFDKIDEFMTKYLKEKEKSEGKIINYFYLTKVLYSEKFKNELDKINEDNFKGTTPKNKDDLIISYKKCMIEVLNYANKIQYENFYELSELKNEKTMKINKSKKNKIEGQEKNNEDKKKKFKNALKISLIKIIDSKKDDDVDFKKIIFPQLRKNIIFEMNYNINNELSQRILFCTNYLHLFMRNLPEKYIDNNYSLLIDELIIETKNNIAFLWSNILIEYHKKIKEAERLNIISSLFNSQINGLETLDYIDFLYKNLSLPCQFEIEKDDNNIISNVIYNDKIDLEEDKNDFIIIIDKEDQHIQNMIKNIPDFREYENEYDNILDIEEKSKIPEAISSYFSSLRTLVGKQKIFKNFDKKSLASIKDQLENYILNKLYDKLFPSEISEEDLYFYKKCERLSFIKPENVVKNKQLINENLLNEAIKYFQQIDDKLTPVDKMKCIEKGRNIIANSINFNSGKTGLGVDDLNQPLIYALIKAKIQNLKTNIQYCELYLNDAQKLGQYGSIFTGFKFAFEIIKNMKYSELIGVTEEQFGKDEFELNSEK